MSYFFDPNKGPAFAIADMIDGLDESDPILEARTRELSRGTVNPWAQLREFRAHPAGNPDESPDTFAKRVNSIGGLHRRAALREFIKRRLALGESLDEIVAFAAQHDPETAEHLRAAAAEI